MRLFFKLSIKISILLLLSLGLIFSYYQYSLFYPKKRPLLKYHYYWLNRLKKSKISVTYHKNRSYLIIKATKESLKTKRFRLLRENLILRGFKPKKINSLIAILLHGKNGRKEDLLPLAERFIAMGFIVIAPDLPAHGNNSNKRLSYNNIFIDSILNDAKKYINLDKKIAIWGFSLGGAYAILNVANSKYNFSSIAVVSTFDSLENVIKDKTNTLFGTTFGDFLANSFISTAKLIYNSDLTKIDITKYAKKIKIPVLIIHGTQDRVIKYKRAKNLFRKFGSKDKYIILDNSNHYTILNKINLLYKSGFFLINDTAQ